MSHKKFIFVFAALLVASSFLLAACVNPLQKRSLNSTPKADVKIDNQLLDSTLGEEPLDLPTGEITDDIDQEINNFDKSIKAVNDNEFDQKNLSDQTLEIE